MGASLEKSAIGFLAPPRLRCFGSDLGPFARRQRRRPGFATLQATQPAQRDGMGVLGRVHGFQLGLCRVELGRLAG